MLRRAAPGWGRGWSGSGRGSFQSINFRRVLRLAKCGVWGLAVDAQGGLPGVREAGAGVTAGTRGARWCGGGKGEAPGGPAAGKYSQGGGRRRETGRWGWLCRRRSRWRPWGGTGPAGEF
ncbi:MAG: hypothetical protein K7J46_16310 [Bryobacter sp.]|nr:hypothetical protein [Bryobacter sp. CoA8 C33]